MRGRVAATQVRMREQRERKREGTDCRDEGGARQARRDHANPSNESVMFHVAMIAITVNADDMIWWYVAIGSAVGGVARFALATVVQQRVGPNFPVGTLVVNITGSFLLGLLLRYALATDAISPDVRAFLTTGFCGGYTTFSTFTYDTLLLMEEGGHARAGLYVLLSVALSLVGAWLGIAAARELIAVRARN
jgi:CrcB protein